MRQLLIFGWLTLLGGVSSALALSRTLAWEDCVAIAAKNNPDLASSLRSKQASQATYYGSFNGLLPSLSLQNSYSDGSSFNPSLGSSLGTTPGGFHWQAQGSASMNIFSMSQIANIRSASANYTEADANLRLASSNLRFNLRQAFAALLFAGQSMEVSDRILKVRERDAELVKLRYDSGRESKGNMMRAEAQVVQARADYAQAQRNVKTAQKTLDRELGLDDFEALIATGTMSTEQPPAELPDNLQQYLSARPDVAVQEAVIEGAKAALSQSWSSIWPTLSGNYTRGRQGTTELPNSRYVWALQGVLSYPLFGGGPTATYFAVRSAKRTLEKSEEDMRSVRDSAVVDLETNWASFAGAVDQVAVQKGLLQAARQRNDEADVRYASGLLTYDNWEIIASDRINTERQAIQTQLNAMNAEAAWDRSVGRLLGE